MRPVQKVLTTLLWACAVVAMVSVIGANMWRGRAGTLPHQQHEAADPHLPVLAEVPPFALVDQNHAPVSLATFRGKPFIANFIFTNCAGPCPLMTAKMASLQKAVPADVKLVSVSVDPKQDTPAVLKEYAQGFRADDARWHFLTAAKPEEADAVFTLARGMLLAAQPATADAPIIHSEKFVLVDADGKIRGYYSSGDAAEMDRLKADAAELAGAKGA